MNAKEHGNPPPAVKHPEIKLKVHPELEGKPVMYQAGAICPQCEQGILDYDGLLNLVCPVCGGGQGGCFT